MLYELKVKAGVIDPDFTGNIGVVLKNNSKEPVELVAGEQIAQLLFFKVATPILVQVPDQDTVWQIWLRGTQCNLIFKFESNLKGIANIVGHFS